MTEDYQLVKNIKDGVDVQKSKMKLFKKYTPLIKKFANRMSSILHNYSYFEDFVQDAYFTIEKTLKWINLSKVSSPDVFRFAVPFGHLLRQQVKKSIQKHNKNINCGTRFIDKGLVRFIHHDISIPLNNDGDKLDIIEDINALNNIDPVYREVAYKAIDDYIAAHHEVEKNGKKVMILDNPITIQDENSSKIYVEKPMKKWQLKYLELIIQGVPMNEIAQMRDVVAAKQEWYRTRGQFEKFLRERINRALDLNIMMV